MPGCGEMGSGPNIKLLIPKIANGTFASPRLFITNHLKTRITATSKRSLSIEAMQRRGTDISLLNAFVFG